MTCKSYLYKCSSILIVSFIVLQRVKRECPQFRPFECKYLIKAFLKDQKLNQMVGITEATSDMIEIILI